MRVRWRVLAVAVTAAALVGGCSGDPPGGPGVASVSGTNQPSAAPADAGKTDEDKAREYAKCMRDHGVNMADPTVDGNGGIGISIEGTDPATVQAAEEACQHLHPNGGQPPQVNAEDLDRMRELAKCMREHGIDVPDPTADRPGISIQGDPAQADEAMKACGHDPAAPFGGKRQQREEPTR